MGKSPKLKYQLCRGKQSHGDSILDELRDVLDKKAVTFKRF
nr:MAG TPA: coil coil domain protein [Caudoviricetes sp.]